MTLNSFNVYLGLDFSDDHLFQGQEVLMTSKMLWTAIINWTQLTLIKRIQPDKDNLHIQKDTVFCFFNGNTFMFLLSKRLNTAGVTVSPCMYVCTSKTVQRIFYSANACSIPSLQQPALVTQSPLLTCEMPNWFLIDHSDVIRHISSSADQPCAYIVKKNLNKMTSILSGADILLRFIV